MLIITAKPDISMDKYVYCNSVTAYFYFTMCVVLQAIALSSFLGVKKGTYRNEREDKSGKGDPCMLFRLTQTLMKLRKSFLGNMR